MKKGKEYVFHLPDSKIGWSIEEPFCIILALIGREDDALCAYGQMIMAFNNVQHRGINYVAKLMFENKITLKDVEYACHVCSEKEMGFPYFVGILKNVSNYSEHCSRDC